MKKGGRKMKGLMKSGFIGILAAAFIVGSLGCSHQEGKQKKVQHRITKMVMAEMAHDKIAPKGHNWNSSTELQVSIGIVDASGAPLDSEVVMIGYESNGQLMTGLKGMTDSNGMIQGNLSLPTGVTSVTIESSHVGSQEISFSGHLLSHIIKI